VQWCGNSSQLCNAQTWRIAFTAGVLCRKLAASMEKYDLVFVRQGVLTKEAAFRHMN